MNCGEFKNIVNSIGSLDPYEKVLMSEALEPHLVSLQRYKKLRMLNPMQFSEIWNANLAMGGGFDLLLDCFNLETNEFDPEKMLTQ